MSSKVQSNQLHDVLATEYIFFVLFCLTELERSLSNSLVNLEASNAELEKFKLERAQLQTQLESVSDQATCIWPHQTTLRDTQRWLVLPVYPSWLALMIHVSTLAGVNYLTLINNAHSSGLLIVRVIKIAGYYSSFVWRGRFAKLWRLLQRKSHFKIKVRRRWNVLRLIQVGHAVQNKRSVLSLAWHEWFSCKDNELKI